MLRMVRLMSAKDDSKQKIGNPSSKEYFGSRLEHLPRFEISNWMYVNSRQNPISFTPSKYPSKKIGLRKVEFYHVKRVKSHIVAAKENRYQNTISTGRVYLASRASKNSEPGFEDKTEHIAHIEALERARKTGSRSVCRWRACPTCRG